MTGPIERLLGQLRVAYYGPSWHGPTLREVLIDVTAEQAARHSIGSAHSIWEIASHSAAWKRVVTERLDRAVPSLQGEADWPAVHDTSPAAWQEVLRQLDLATNNLINRVRLLPVADLDGQVPGDVISVYAMVHGVIQHDVYHAGQIALLKKLQRA
jgi:hypothetical protein